MSILVLPNTDPGVIIPFKGIMNELYALDCSRKVGAAKARNQEKGVISQRSAAYGYRVDKEANRLVADPETAGFVPLIYSWYADDIGPAEIVGRLTEVGAPTPLEHLEGQVRFASGEARNHGAPWNVHAVLKILDDPCYTGDLHLRKYHQSLVEGQKKRTVSPDEQCVFEDTHEPLVDEELWQRVRDLRESRSDQFRERMEKGERYRKKLPNVFKGIVFCGHCGRQMRFARSLREGRYRGACYECVHHEDGEICVCEPFPAQLLRIVVADQMRAQVRAACAYEQVVPALAGDDHVRKRRSDLETNVLACRLAVNEASRAKQELYQDYVEGRVTLESFTGRKNQLSEKEAKAKEELKAAETTLREFDGYFSAETDFDDAVAAVRDIDTFSEELMRALISRIDIYAGRKVQITFTFCDWTQRARGLMEAVL